MSETAEKTEAGELVDGVLTIDTQQTDAAKEAEDVEIEALAMGWKPKDGFKGDESKFVDAPEYVRRGKEIMPFLRKELATSNAKLAKLEKTLERFAEHHSKTEQRMYAKAMEDVQSRIDTAASAGDVQAVRDATDELVGLTKEASVPKPALDTEAQATFEEWKADNPWYGKDSEMTAEADVIGNDLFNRKKLTGKEQGAEVTRRIKLMFPDKFENPRRNGAATVEGGIGTRKPAGKTYSDLPADAKKACDDFCRDIKGYTKEKYCKEYFA